MTIHRPALRLATARRGAGLSQQALGRRANVWPQVISALETERLRLSPKSAILRRLARVLRISAADLLQPVDDVVGHDE